MDATSSFGAQLSALRRRQRDAEQALALLAGLRPSLAANIRPGFENAMARIADDARALARRGPEAKAPVERWADLRKARGEADELFAECLALAEGVWAREQGLDGDLCVLADALAGEIGSAMELRWDRLTVPADREFYVDAAQVIRVKLPTAGIWDLPLVAHEFGHFAAERLEVVERHRFIRPHSNPFRDLIGRAADRGEQSWSFAQEYFADAFATYAIGPAYAYTCVLLRFDPVGAHRNAGLHPAPATRVQLMLGVLARMDAERIGLVPFGKRAEKLADLWHATLVDAGEAGSLASEDAELVGDLADELVGLLMRHRRAAAYDSFDRAQGLSRTLGDRRAAAATASGDRIADVLNAAWLARIDAWESATRTDAIAVDAAALCRRIADSRREAA
jgi:hypothetical protein